MKSIIVRNNCKKNNCGVEWSGVEWSGVEWSGVEWTIQLTLQKKMTTCTFNNNPLRVVNIV